MQDSIFSIIVCLFVILTLYYTFAGPFRWMLLLLASLLFYSTYVDFYLITILITSSILVYLIAIAIERVIDYRYKFYLLWSGIILCSMPLVYFKYYPFIIENLNQLLLIFRLKTSFSSPKILSFIGVSYYTFQAISYLADVYLKRFKAEKHFGFFLLYQIFFPKILQGPIERASDLITQLKNECGTINSNNPIINWDNIQMGLLFCLSGFFKKLVVADRLGMYVNEVFKNTTSYDGYAFWIGSFFYTFQIYYDFSGLTDISLGIARFFNIKLTNNFNYPFLATSISDFWKRWHISLSRWLMDYIFTPLLFSCKKLKFYAIPFSLMITFIVCGIWHGANWTFVAWGFFHGTLLSMYYITEDVRKKLWAKTRIAEESKIRSVVAIFVTFVSVSLSMVFSRAVDISSAFYIFSKLLTFEKNSFSDLFYKLTVEKSLLKNSAYDFFLSIALIVLLYSLSAWTVFYKKDRDFFIKKFFQLKFFTKVVVYIFLLVVIFIFSVSEKSDFIYINF
ncbi:MAG: MBOAT family protein [Oligoflexia bacterium]|nr:MBOAT family protein [Oligoflexia bacterium]